VSFVHRVLYRNGAKTSATGTKAGEAFSNYRRCCVHGITGSQRTDFNCRFPANAAFFLVFCAFATSLSRVRAIDFGRPFLRLPFTLVVKFRIQCHAFRSEPKFFVRAAPIKNWVLGATMLANRGKTATNLSEVRDVFRSARCRSRLCPRFGHRPAVDVDSFMFMPYCCGSTTRDRFDPAQSRGVGHKQLRFLPPIKGSS